MSPQDKKKQLESLIVESITPLIDHDYVLLDLPYHSNLGDTLIWQGELDFLRCIPFKCHHSTWWGGNASKGIKSDSTILLHGGGNFGDIWPSHQIFRKKVIEQFPNNKVIIFPQTIYYSDRRKLEDDAVFFEKFSNVIISARDEDSYQICRDFFPNNKSMLVPDMAFCMDMSKYKREKQPKGNLFVRRTDLEINENVDYSIVPKDVVESDWVWLEHSREYYRRYMIEKKISRFDQFLGTDFKNLFNDLYWHHFLRELNVKTAIQFIDKYESIYTTRMHAAILSVILGKKNVVLFDNSYGKSSSFYNTWLKDVDGLSLSC
jgi:pyruvyl transferase EpsO